MTACITSRRPPADGVIITKAVSPSLYSPVSILNCFLGIICVCGVNAYHSRQSLFKLFANNTELLTRLCKKQGCQQPAVYLLQGM